MELFCEFLSLFWFFFFLPTKLSNFLKGHVYSSQTIWVKKVWKAGPSQSPSPMTSASWVWVTIPKAWPVLCFSPGHGHYCQGTAPLQKASGDSSLRAWTPLLGIRLTFALWVFLHGSTIAPNVFYPSVFLVHRALRGKPTPVTPGRVG